MDPRVVEHARIIVEWSAEIKRGDNVVISASPQAQDLVVALNREIARVGAHVINTMDLQDASKAYLDAADEKTLSEIPEHLMALMEKSDVLIYVRAPSNTRTMASIDPQKMLLVAKSRQPLRDIQLSKRWTLTVHPCPALAQEANMSLEEYQDFVYEATLLDWKKESELMHLLKEHLERHSDIRYIGPETDLYAKTEGRIWIASDGKHNLPSGEVFTAPIEDSVEGKIYFDIPFLQRGRVIQGVRLTFEKGEVVDFSAEKEEATLKQIIETDEGSRRLGEIAIGTNRGIKRYTLNMLFDEKIGDTIHCALGNAYEECKGKNKSAVHVDMVKSMREGEIIAGDEVIYSKGKFFWEK